MLGSAYLAISSRALGCRETEITCKTAGYKLPGRRFVVFGLECKFISVNAHVDGCFKVETSMTFTSSVKQGRSQDFSKGGSHWVIQRVLTRLSPEYCGLSAYKKAYKGGVTGTPGPPPGYALGVKFGVIFFKFNSLFCSLYKNKTMVG